MTEGAGFLNELRTLRTDICRGKAALPEMARLVVSWSQRFPNRRLRRKSNGRLTIMDGQERPVDHPAALPADVVRETTALVRVFNQRLLADAHAGKDNPLGLSITSDPDSLVIGHPLLGEVMATRQGSGIWCKQSDDPASGVIISAASPAILGFHLKRLLFTDQGVTGAIEDDQHYFSGWLGSFLAPDGGWVSAGLRDPWLDGAITGWWRRTTAEIPRRTLTILRNMARECLPLASAGLDCQGMLIKTDWLEDADIGDAILIHRTAACAAAWFSAISPPDADPRQCLKEWMSLYSLDGRVSDALRSTLLGMPVDVPGWQVGRLRFFTPTTPLISTMRFFLAILLHTQGPVAPPSKTWVKARQMNDPTYQEIAEAVINRTSEDDLVRFAFPHALWRRTKGLNFDHHGKAMVLPHYDSRFKTLSMHLSPFIRGVVPMVHMSGFIQTGDYPR